MVKRKSLLRAFAFVSHPHDAFRLGDFLVQGLASENWTQFRAAIAFVKQSGTKHIRSDLAAFSRRALVTLSVGIDSGGTSREGLQDLIAATSRTGKLFVFHNANRSTFHPKIYLFRNTDAADVVIGSGNLTEGGLYTSYEASVRLNLKLSSEHDRSMLQSIEDTLDQWSTATQGLCVPLDEGMLNKLVENGLVLPEVLTREAEEASLLRSRATRRLPSIFDAVRVPRAPAAEKSTRDRATSKTATSPRKHLSPPESKASNAFLMTLQNTDMGYGQKTAGTSRRSPELFVPIKAVDMNPAFWGWPDLFAVDEKWRLEHREWIAAKRAGRRRSQRPLEKMDRYGVRIRITKTGEIVAATIWYNPDKIDLRIRHQKLRAAGKVGDLLLLTKAPETSACDFEFEVVDKSDVRYADLDAVCDTPIRNSPKRVSYV